MTKWPMRLAAKVEQRFAFPESVFQVVDFVVGRLPIGPPGVAASATRDAPSGRKQATKPDRLPHSLHREDRTNGMVVEGGCV
jgi:hypothetical protein